MTDVERARRQVLGRTVSLLRAGVPGDAPVLLLHGVPTSAALWTPVLERLEGARAVAPDLPGYGHSEPPRNPSIVAYHRFISQLTRAEGMRLPVLVGHDLGGLYALTYALANPGALGGLVLLNTTIYPDPRVALGLVPLLAPGFGEAYAWLAGRERYRPLVRRDLGAMYPPETPPELRPELTEPYGRTRAWLSLLRSLRGLSPPRVLLWQRRMRELRIPVLILWGQGDPYFPPSIPHRLHRDLPTSQLQYVPNGGHFLMLSSPAATADAIQRCVAATPPPSRTP